MMITQNAARLCCAAEVVVVVGDDFNRHHPIASSKSPRTPPAPCTACQTIDKHSAKNATQRVRRAFYLFSSLFSLLALLCSLALSRPAALWLWLSQHAAQQRQQHSSCCCCCCCRGSCHLSAGKQHTACACTACVSFCQHKCAPCVRARQLVCCVLRSNGWRPWKRYLCVCVCVWRGAATKCGGIIAAVVVVVCFSCWRCNSIALSIDKRWEYV